jgi:outer membrane receptor protein involved in Fe transport
VLGQPFNGVPKWTRSAMAQYSVPLGMRDFFIRGDYSYTGARVSFNNVPAAEGGRPIPSYDVVNMSVGFNQGPWKVALVVRNLFNKIAAIDDLLSENIELTGRPQWFITTPRTLGLELRRDFGSRH